MEARKLQKVGYSTLSVSLPSHWVKENGLRQGDQIVFIPEKDGTMHLTPRTVAERQSSETEYSINADLCDEPGLLDRLIVANYVHGRDTISVRSSKRVEGRHMQEVRTVVHKLIGLGIIEETPNKITLQCSIDPSKFPLSTIMRRLHILTTTIQSEAMQALVEGDFDLAKQAISRDSEADMMYWLIVRLLLAAQHDRTIADKIGVSDLLHIVGDRVIAKYLEAIASQSERIAQNVKELEKYKHDLQKPVISQLDHLNQLALVMCKKAMDCMYTRDLKLANSAILMKDTIEGEEIKFTEQLTARVNNPNVVARFRAIALALRNIADNAYEIAEVAINRVMEQPNKFCDHIPSQEN